jgi:hypothetical protein
VAERLLVLPPVWQGGRREKPDLGLGHSVWRRDRHVFYGFIACFIRSALDRPILLGRKPALSKPGGFRSRDSGFNVAMDIHDACFSDDQRLMPTRRE